MEKLREVFYLIWPSWGRGDVMEGCFNTRAEGIPVDPGGVESRLPHQLEWLTGPNTQANKSMITAGSFWVDGPIV